MGRFPSGQRGQTVNLLANAFEGSNPSLPIPFYRKQGLAFECQRCSACCRYSPGFVFLTKNDLAHLLEYTGKSYYELVGLYLRLINMGSYYRLSLREKANYDCIFWENGGCMIYPSRPLQCATFPFWNSLLSSESLWQEQKKLCPGIGKGRVFSFVEIERLRQDQLRQELLTIQRCKSQEEEDAIFTRMGKELNLL